ncbi:integrase, partial [Pseudomonas amygdali pv. morsprunorum]|nr:integrase [Pseudomonas amygdali pv. morsprunorum]MDT3228074.1 integrase [Pseudomonas amygdali pv. morsprunorum]
MQEVTKVGTHDQRRLTAVEFQQLARVPAAVEWFANL